MFVPRIAEPRKLERSGGFYIQLPKTVILVTGYLWDFSQSIITSARLMSRFLRSCSTSSKTSFRRSTAKRFMLALSHFLFALLRASDNGIVPPSFRVLVRLRSLSLSAVRRLAYVIPFTVLFVNPFPSRAWPYYTPVMMYCKPPCYAGILLQSACYTDLKGNEKLFLSTGKNGIKSQVKGDKFFLIRIFRYI